MTFLNATNKEFKGFSLGDDNCSFHRRGRGLLADLQRVQVSRRYQWILHLNEKNLTIQLQGTGHPYNVNERILFFSLKFTYKAFTAKISKDLQENSAERNKETVKQYSG